MDMNHLAELYIKYGYMFMITDSPKWHIQRQASIFAMQTTKQAQQLLWQRWWCTLCQRLLYLHLQTSKWLLGREWSSNVEPQENRSRRWNGRNIEPALLSSNYLIFIFVGSHTVSWTCWFVSDSLVCTTLRKQLHSFDCTHSFHCLCCVPWVLCLCFRFSLSV
jgi:hypothetical protein